MFALFVPIQAVPNLLTTCNKLNENITMLNKIVTKFTTQAVTMLLYDYTSLNVSANIICQQPNFLIFGVKAIKLFKTW